MYTSLIHRRADAYAKGTSLIYAPMMATGRWPPLPFTVINSNGPPTEAHCIACETALVRWMTQQCAMERRATGNVVPDGT